MKKILLFVLLLVPVPVFATYMEPTLGCLNSGSTSQCGSIKYEILNGNDWYIANFDIYPNRVNKVTFIYDMSQFNDTYVNFILYSTYEFNDVVASLDNDLCEMKTGALSTTYATSGTQANLNRPSYYGFTCKVAKKSEVYLNIFISRTYNEGSRFYISANNKTYNDLNTAIIQNSIDTQTQQQQQQFNQITDSNNSTNQSDFITFATNYFIDDKTGTKSFLNVVPNFLNQLDNGSCTPLTITIPFISRNNQLTIPCMVTFLGEHGFGNLIRIYQFVISFIVAYWLTVNWFKLFKETIDPFNYRIEVMDL